MTRLFLLFTVLISSFGLIGQSVTITADAEYCEGATEIQLDFTGEAPFEIKLYRDGEVYETFRTNNTYYEFIPIGSSTTSFLFKDDLYIGDYSFEDFTDNTNVKGSINGNSSFTIVPQVAVSLVADRTSTCQDDLVKFTGIL